MSRAGGKIERPPVETRTVKDPSIGQRCARAVGKGLARGVVAVLLLTFRYPFSAALVAAAAWLTVVFSEDALIAATTVTMVGLILWAWRDRISFEAFVGITWRSRVRAWWVYRRKWPEALSMCGLSSTFAGIEYVPVLRTVRSDDAVDRVLISLCHGITTAKVADACDELASSFGAERCEVVADKPGRCWLVFTRKDRLAEPVPALPIPKSSDLAVLPVGARQDVMAYPRRLDVVRGVVDRVVSADGRLVQVLTLLRLAGGTGVGDMTWNLRLFGTHVLIAGATGAGKGSVLWSLIRALIPGVRSGLVQLWVIDPKGGMELAFGAPLFHRFCYGEDPDTLEDGKRRAFELSFAEFLEDLVAEMRRRQERLRGRFRQHVPSVGDPAIVLVVDEYASLTAYVRDREAKNRIADAMNLLLSQGRAVNVLVVAAVQDPRKETVPNRGLFPTRIALRLAEEAETDLILGKAARLRGAACHDIPHATPGVGYVVLDGVRDPVRVRAGHVTDADIEAMVLEPTGPDTGELFAPIAQADSEGRWS